MTACQMKDICFLCALKSGNFQLAGLGPDKSLNFLIFDREINFPGFLK
jgi:hypothetical protein